MLATYIRFNDLSSVFVRCTQWRRNRRKRETNSFNDLSSVFVRCTVSHAEQSSQRERSSFNDLSSVFVRCTPRSATTNLTDADKFQ